MSRAECGRAIVSVRHLVPPGKQAAVQRSAAALKQKLGEFGREQRRRLRQAARRRAEGLGLSGEISPIAPERDRRMSEAASIIVERKRFGTIPLDDLPVAEREGYLPATWWNHRVAALYWCDGKRNLAEVIRRTVLELGPTGLDFVGYFRFLERNGYVRFVETAAR